MSRRALTLATATAVLAVAGCGGGGDKPSRLSWSGKPQVFRSRTLRHDRIVMAHVRNTSNKTLYLLASKLVVRDADGRRLNGSAAFTNSYAHGLFGAYQQPDPVPPAELLRLGKAVYIPPGASVPFYAAWRLGPHTREPVSIDYGSGSLKVPSEDPRPTAS